MAYRSDDGSYSRAGSGRRPEWPSDAGYGEPPAYGAYEDYGDTSGLADPYGPPGAQITRDPVRGYPPAPEIYDDAYGQEPGYASAPVYSDQPFHGGAVYDDPPYGGYDTGYDAYEQAPPGRSYPPGPDSGGYPPGPEVTGYEPGPPTGGYATVTEVDGFPPATRADGYPPGPGAGYPPNPYDEPPAPPRRKSSSGSGGKGSGGKGSGKGKKAAKSPKRGRRVGMILGVTSGIVVLAVAATAYLLLTKPAPANPGAASDSSTTHAQVPAGPTSSAAAACAARLGQYCHIETRTSDPTALSLAELFRPQFTTLADGSSFVEQGQQLSKDCSGAVIGSGLQNAIKAGTCTQVLRASYVSANNQMMGTIGVFNLVSTTAADKAGRAVDGSDFLSPLATSKGVTKSLGKGTGVVEAEFKGHYLILTWAEFTNLKSPDQHGDHTLETFESDLVSGTANIALSERMVTGQPAGATG